MKLWYIWGMYLPVLLIEADTFDKALEEARRINPNYNTGQLRENDILSKDLLRNVWKYTF